MFAEKKLAYYTLREMRPERVLDQEEPVTLRESGVNEVQRSTG